MSQLAPHAAHRRTVRTPTGPVTVLDTGPGRLVPVLLVPGYTGSKEDFAPLLDRIAAAGRRAVAIDLPGQYESPGPDDPAAYAVETLAADVSAVIAELDARPHLVGHSFGGLVGRASVLADPSAVTSFALLDSGPAAAIGVRRSRLEALEPVLDSGGLPAVYAAMEAAGAGDPRWQATPADVRAFLKHRFLSSSAAGLKGMGDALRREPDRVDELAAAGVPLLVAWGIDDDAWPPPVQEEMARRLGAPSAVIPDAQHSPAVENPDETARVLLEFWSTVDKNS